MCPRADRIAHTQAHTNPTHACTYKSYTLNCDTCCYMYQSYQYPGKSVQQKQYKYLHAVRALIIVNLVYVSLRCTPDVYPTPYSATRTAPRILLDTRDTAACKSMRAASRTHVSYQPSRKERAAAVVQAYPCCACACRTPSTCVAHRKRLLPHSNPGWFVYAREREIPGTTACCKNCCCNMPVPGMLVMEGGRAGWRCHVFFALHLRGCSWCRGV